VNFSSINSASSDSTPRHARRAAFRLTLVLLAGCLDTASNYGAVLPSVDQNTDNQNGGDVGDGDTSSGDGDGKKDDDDKGDGDSTSGDGDTSSGDGDEAKTDGGSKPVMMMSLIKGTAKKAGCSSYQEQDGDDQCAGYYCGVSMDMIEAELKGGGKCDPTPKDVCSGKVTTRVAQCARDTKKNPVNAFDSDAMIRAKTLTCIQMDTSIDASEECLGCFLDAAQCASKNCLTQCLTGDNANCDTCRLNNNCNQPVPLCAGLPTPF
jgi:hypothetical protein